MKECIICGCKTNKPIKNFLAHFKPIELENIPFLKGTYQAFGLKPILTMISPLLNTLINWKYRKHRLEIKGFPDEN